MQSNIPVIWFKSYPDPQASFAGSLWIAIHTQIYNYMHISNYIIRINKINSIISYKDYFGFLVEDSTLDRISSAVNRNLRKLKNSEFKLLLSEDGDPQRAINYMEKGRVIVIGIPAGDINRFTGYNTINEGTPSSIIYYLVAAIDGDRVYFIPGMDGVEIKAGLKELYNEYSDTMVKMHVNEFVEYCETNRNAIKIIYASVLTKTGEEVRSLNEY
ncbi:MAG: hypothetical protein RE471_01000 [Ferroplasma sp.]|uniref:hypothetical protein n=1 Tax=Ferroplasma sp. TaxID=2591003 RepID=UPI002815E5B9|nr:hypothetical protein [Ferroplasma sp.]WMT51473.1 MAG: hypothetical protein RE471_01000 [Ferroplasma sp.]